MSNENTTNNGLDLESYNEELQEKTQELRQLAEQARQKQSDPKDFVEIDQADDIAERCEMLLKEELGEIDGLQDEIRYYEENTDLGREEIAFKISDKFVDGEIGGDLNERERVEAAVRTAIALLTEGVVAAPIEGIGEVTIEQNDDGTDYIRIHYNGPIRSAGGTGQALSVLVADHVRQELGMESFKPRDEEVERYKEEIQLYDDDVGLQYMPKDKEIRTIIKNCPVMLDGMQTIDKEVAGYRDLERIDGNRPRGGVCLVAAEGLAQKAPKMKRIVDGNNIKGWDWLTELSTVTTTDDNEEDDEEETENNTQKEIDYTQPTPNLLNPGSIDHPVFEPTKKFQKSITGGRPIFSGPSQKGGFRLRYGRGRNTGIASSGFHPATMIATDEFIATGVQQKTERPGKATGTAPVTGIEGPTVRLDNGTVLQLTSEKQARELEDQIEYIIDIGEILLNYGEFLENNHPLAPSPYVPEWWIQDLQQAGMNTESIDPTKVNFQTALSLSDKFNVPIHPDHTYLFNDITAEEYHKLSTDFQSVEETDHEKYDYEFTTDNTTKTTIENLLIEHKQISEQDTSDTGYHSKDEPEDTTEYEYTILIEEDDYNRLNHYLDPDLDHTQYEKGIECVNATIDQTTLPRVTTRIGSRMGRPEKSDIRAMRPPIHGLFPLGKIGGKGRNLYKAANNTEGSNRNVQTGRANQDYTGQGTTKVQLNNRICSECNETTWKVRCPNCDVRTQKIAQCYNCGNIKRPEMVDEECTSCYNGKYKLATRQQLDVKTEVDRAIENLGENINRLPKTKGVEGLTSESKVPEPIEKTILRGKYDVYPFRDGTVRYDMVDLPLTSFKVEEIIGLDLETAKDLGYTHTLDGDPLETEKQLTEIYPQDIVVSEDAGEYLLQTANYIDQLLEDYYDMDPYYNADSKEDLIGSLLMGLAPHTSASVAARLIGFTDSKVQLGHPLFHAAKRRNCFHPDTQMNYKINGEWKETSIQKLVETYLDPEVNGYDDSYDDGSIVQDIKQHPEIDELKVPSMTDEGHRTLENVTHLSKHAPQDHLIKITLDDETTLEVTPDHSIPVKAEDSDDELMEKKDAHQLEEGEELFDYGRNKLEEVQNFKEIDLLEQLLTTDHDVDLEKVMIRGMEKEQVYDLLIDEIKPKWDDGQFYKMSSSVEYLDIPKKSLDNYLRRQSIPVSLFQELYKEHDNPVETIIENIPRDVELGMNSDSVESPRLITLDEELATLIGYYTAEGFTRVKEDDRVDHDMVGSTHTDIAATEEQTREFVKSTFKKKFNVNNPYEGDTRITVSGNMVRFFFGDVLDSGKYAETKSVPNMIQEGSDKIKGAYLSGYISGDGSYFRSRFEMVTISETLKDELIELFEELGFDSIEYTIREPTLLREKFPDFYDEDCERMSKKGYELILDHHETVKFINRFGVQLKRKQKVFNHNRDVKTIESVTTVLNNEPVYNLTVENTNRLEANFVNCRNCDGDEDSVMFVLDGFLNFSREYLPDAIGRRSVTKDTEIYTRDDGVNTQERVGELFQKYAKNTTIIENEEGWELIDAPDSLEVISFDTDTGEISYEHPTKIMRHTNDKDVYEITTEYDGSIKMTGDHGIFVHKDGEIKDYDARDVEVGDHIIVPEGLPQDANIEIYDVENVRGDVGFEEVTSIEEIDYGDDYVYDLEVPGKQNFLTGPHPIFAHNTMDAPLLMTAVIDPTEVDDEAHMVDVVDQYSREFYLQSWDMPGPKEVDIEVIEDMLGGEIKNVKHTIETDSVNAGPYSSRYPKLEGMQNKVDRQLALAAKSRSVSEKVVASKVIDKHFFPDIRGNLRAYAQQDFRCTSCETKYRRVPLTGECPECADGGNLIFTVHEGMVRKYLEPTLEIADKYEIDEYVRQQLEEIKREINSIYEKDTETQTGLDDFM